MYLERPLILAKTLYFNPLVVVGTLLLRGGHPLLGTDWASLEGRPNLCA